MAEEVKSPAAAEAAESTEIPTRSAEGAEEPSTAEATADDATATGEGAESAETSPKKDTTSSDAIEGAEKAEDDAAASTATPASSKKAAAANKRKSTGGGVPEHNRRKSMGKKKDAPELHLDAQPGEMYFVAMKGYPPWPVMVCDEDILPEVLLSKRPVSAKRIDGTYREDYADGGKHIKDRRFPIMFLGTNEFSWEANTNLRTLDIEQVKKEVEAGNTQKKKKALWEAFEIAAEENDLQYFKDMLRTHEEAMQVDAEEKVKKQEKKGKRKSTAPSNADDMDVDEDNDDAETGAKKAVKNKKRKKDEDSDGEPEKAVKTPKSTKLTIKNKTPKEASAAKPKPLTKAQKAKEAKAAAKSEESEESSESAKVEEKPMTEEERRVKTEKSVLYLRHRLQKGFLTRDQAPKEDEMEGMSEHFTQLEAFKNLSAEIIRKTKVHKVLKAIMKLESIPKEGVYDFKQRSANILQSWSSALAAEEPAAEVAAAPAAAPTVNGTNGVQKKTTEPAESADKPTETTEGGDVVMADAQDETPTAAVEPSVEAESTDV